MRKRSFIALALIGLTTLSAFAEQPEIAYRILNGYVTKQEESAGKGQRIAGGILMGIGGLAVAGAAATWLYGDEIAQAGTGSPMPADAKIGMTLGFGIAGAATMTTGALLFAAKPHDFRVEYSEVFSEDDPEIREALAVAALRDLSIKAERARVTGALSSLLVPLISGAIKAGMNVSEGEAWNKDLFSSIGWSAWSIAGGISSLFGKTEEERLYEKYRAGREALYGPTN